MSAIRKTAIARSLAVVMSAALIMPMTAGASNAHGVHGDFIPGMIVGAFINSIMHHHRHRHYKKRIKVRRPHYYGPSFRHRHCKSSRCGWHRHGGPNGIRH